MKCLLHMNCLQLIYLLSLSLQVTGALILIIYCWGNTERCILNAIYPANTELHREENDTVIIKKEKLYKAHKVVLLNRNAFIFIGVGCPLSLFGLNGGINPWIGLMIVAIVSCILLKVVAFIAHLIAKYSNLKDRIYSYKELCSKLDSNIATNATVQECADIVNELT